MGTAPARDLAVDFAFMHEYEFLEVMIDEYVHAINSGNEPLYPYVFIEQSTGQVRNHFIKSWKTSAVSTTVWMVGTQPCKLRGTSDAFVKYGFCELNLRYDY